MMAHQYISWFGSATNCGPGEWYEILAGMCSLSPAYFMILLEEFKFGPVDELVNTRYKKKVTY